MPRFNRRRNFRRRRGRAAWYNKKYSTAQIARAAWRATKYIRGLVNSEMLHKETSLSTTVSTTPFVTCLTGLAQGDTDAQRTGNSVLLRNMLYRLRLTMSNAATTTIVRLVVVKDTQQVSDTNPAWNDVFGSASVDAALYSSNAGRFKVLWNKTIVLDTSRPIWHREKYSKLYQHLRFNGAGATDIQKNAIYLMVLSDQATNSPNLNGIVKIGYHDN